MLHKGEDGAGIICCFIVLRGAWRWRVVAGCHSVLLPELHLPLCRRRDVSRCPSRSRKTVISILVAGQANKSRNSTKGGAITAKRYFSQQCSPCPGAAQTRPPWSEYPSAHTRLLPHSICRGCMRGRLVEFHKRHKHICKIPKYSDDSNPDSWMRIYRVSFPLQKLLYQILACAAAGVHRNPCPGTVSI